MTSYYKRAGVIVFSQDEEDGTCYLLLGKSKISNKYSDFGGKIEEGETEVEAAIRELEEETGGQIVTKDVKKYTEGYYHLQIKKTNWETLHLENNEEMSELKWFEFNFIRQNLYETISYTPRKIFKSFLKKPPLCFRDRFRETCYNKKIKRVFTDKVNPRFSCLLN